MDSIWKKEISMPEFPALHGAHKTDVLIIGGGLTGLLCAYRLKCLGIDCLLVEADRICSGVTGNTTAKLTAQHGLIYHKLLDRFGAETAKGYLDANLQALSEYRRICGGIDCDLEEKDAFVYTVKDQRNIEKELRALQRLGYRARFSDSLPLPFPVVGAVCFPEQAQFHPLKFAAAISKDLQIFEQTRITELQPGRALFDRGHIDAAHIIIATHFPFLNKHGSYFLKLYQHRSYVMALSGAPAVPGMYVDEAKTGFSFRTQGDFLLVGGGGHRTGKPGAGWQPIQELAQQHYPGAGVAARWASQDCMPLDDLPYIGQYSSRTENLYVASGFQKWGMTQAMTASMVLADLVLGKPNPYAGLFSPSRSMLHPQLAANISSSLLGLLRPTAPRCPHMGCALQYNRQEHSWDCPCHGSRFSEDGAVLDNPANSGLNA